MIRIGRYVDPVNRERDRYLAGLIDVAEFERRVGRLLGLSEAGGTLALGDGHRDGQDLPAGAQFPGACQAGAGWESSGAPSARSSV